MAGGPSEFSRNRDQRPRAAVHIFKNRSLRFYHLPPVGAKMALVRGSCSVTGVSGRFPHPPPSISPLRIGGRMISCGGPFSTCAPPPMRVGRGGGRRITGHLSGGDQILVAATGFQGPPLGSYHYYRRIGRSSDDLRKEGWRSSPRAQGTMVTTPRQLSRRGRRKSRSSPLSLACVGRKQSSLCSLSSPPLPPHPAPGLFYAARARDERDDLRPEDLRNGLPHAQAT